MSGRKKVLIVDDERDFADGIAFLLDSEGYKTSVVTSGHSLLERLQSEKPDLILLDMMMPAYNGLEVTIALQGNPMSRSVPVILMSASKEPKEHPKPWVDFISKPADIDQLLGKIATALKP